MSEQKDFLQRFNLKDEQAYHKLFQQFYSYLVLFAERRVENHKVAEDIVQEYIAEDTAEPPEILTFKKTSIGETVHFNCQCVFSFL